MNAQPVRWRQPRFVANVSLIAVVLVWGTTFSLVKAALADAPPLLFNLLRMTLAFVLLAVPNGPALRAMTRREFRLAAVAGVFLGLGYQFQTAGLRRTGASTAAFITGLVVVIVPLLSTWSRLRPADAPAPRPVAYAGALVAFCGLALLTSGAGTGSRLLSGFGWGEALTLICAVAFAMHLLWLARAARQVQARALGTVQIGAAALLMVVTLPLGGRAYLHGTVRLAIALAVTAVLATAAAFTIQSWAQQYLSPTHTALLFTLEPVFAWLTALLFFHERMSGRQLLGAAAILAGVLLAELPSQPVDPVAEHRAYS